MSPLLLMMALASGEPASGAVDLGTPLMAYQQCVTRAADRFSPLVKTSGPQSGVESGMVADRALAACGHERDVLKQAAIASMRAKPEYRDRTDLDAQAEAGLQPFDTMFKEDARTAALFAFANRK